MLCTTCNDDILDDDNINYTKCKAIMHFGCATLRESAFRTMTKTAKQNWQCNSCKTSKEFIGKIQTPNNNTYKGRLVTQKSQDDTIKNLVDSVNFMSDKFDNFSKQLQELITTINYIKDENDFLKEENCKLKNKIASLDKRMNAFEQKASENVVEIMGVPDFNNEDCVKTVVSIAASVGIENFSVSKAYRVHSKDGK